MRNELIPLSDLILEVTVNPELHRLPTGLNRVEGLSALRGIDKKDIWRHTVKAAFELRKSGSVIMHADEANRHKNISGLESETGRVGFDNSLLLAIPTELQRIVDDAVKKGNRAIVIIRTVHGNNIDDMNGLIR